MRFCRLSLRREGVLGICRFLGETVNCVTVGMRCWCKRCKCHDRYVYLGDITK